MSASAEKLSRREQILQALASMLESNLGERITTASLAAQVGVSEAALYRHFPSKAKMFEGLIGFIDEAIFTRINLILNDIPDAEKRCETILYLVLGFAEKNPGLSRLLSGDALVGETARLREHMQRFFNRIETQFKQILKEAELSEGKVPTQTASAAANLLTLYLEGKVRQYVRSEFKQLPTAYWSEQWQMLSPMLLRTIQLDRLPN